MKEQFARLGIEVERVAAVDGRQFPNGVPAVPYAKWRSYVSLQRRMTPAMIAVAASHLGICRKMTEQNIPCALVLEDDVALDDAFPEALARVGATLDPMRPQVYSFNGYGLADKDGRDEEIRSVGKMWCADAYVLTAAAARAILKDNDHVKMGIMTGVLRVAKEGILSGLNNPNAMRIGPDDIAVALDRGNPQAFRDAIQRFLVESVSYFDSASEGFFHGLTLGFLAILRDRYRVRSNCEAGEGRFDIELKPLIPEFPGVILEVERAKNARANLKNLARSARRQIDRRGYAAALKSEGVADILKIGLAYCRKRVEIA